MDPDRMATVARRERRGSRLASMALPPALANEAKAAFKAWRDARSLLCLTLDPINAAQPGDGVGYETGDGVPGAGRSFRTDGRTGTC